MGKIIQLEYRVGFRYPERSHRRLGRMVQDDNQRIIIQTYIAHYQRSDRMGIASGHLAEHRPDQQSRCGSNDHFAQHTAQGFHLEHDFIRHLEQGTNRRTT